MTSFERLARVEMQIVMQHCDQTTLLRLARCSRITLAAASHSFAWRSLAPITVQCDSPLAQPSHVSRSLLRFAHLDVEWGMRPQSKAGNSDGAEAGGETAEQQDARAATETAALAALPGLRRLVVWGRSADVGRLFTALLARLDNGSALADLQLHMSAGQLRHADCQSLAALVARSRTLTALRAEGRFDSRALCCLADGMRQSQSLTTLSLSRMNLGTEAAIALGAATAQSRSLTDLHLDCSITDAGIQALVTTLESGRSSIRSLILTDNAFGPAGAASLASLLAADRCAIEHIDLSCCGFGDEGAKALAAALRTNCSLTRLQLADCYVETEGTAALAAALQTNPRLALRQLDLSASSVDAAGAVLLASFLRANITLEQLDLSFCDLDDAAVAALAAGLPAARSLRELRLSHNSFGVEGATALAAGVGACPSLTLLDVCWNRALGDGGMGALAPGLTHLRHFDASHCALTGSAVPLASLVQPGRQLVTLLLIGNPIGTRGVSVVAAALHSSSALRDLDLAGCDVGAEGAAALGEALLRGWACTDLDLSSSQQIGDHGARALAAALGQCGGGGSLRALCLSHCGLTPLGVLALVRASAALPSLRQLTLFTRSAILDEDRLALHAACGANPHFQLLLRERRIWASRMAAPAACDPPAACARLRCIDPPPIRFPHAPIFSLLAHSFPAPPCPCSPLSLAARSRALNPASTRLRRRRCIHSRPFLCPEH